MFPRQPHESRMVEPSMEAAGIEPAQDSSGYIYVILRESDGLLKIGTTRDLATRLRQLRHQHGDVLLVTWEDGDRAEELWLHNKYADSRVAGEWFDSDRLYLDAIEGRLMESPPYLNAGAQSSDAQSPRKAKAS